MTDPCYIARSVGRASVMFGQAPWLYYYWARPYSLLNFCRIEREVFSLSKSMCVPAIMPERPIDQSNFNFAEISYQLSKNHKKLYHSQEESVKMGICKALFLLFRGNKDCWCSNTILLAYSSHEVCGKLYSFRFAYGLAPGIQRGDMKL